MAAQIVHYNDTVTTTPATLNFTEVIDFLAIHNVGNKKLLVSFDGGVNYYSIAPNNELSIGGVSLTSIMLKASVSTTDYEILVGQ